MKYLEKDTDFRELIKKDNVLVDFYATWCGPCQMLGPVLEKLAKSHPDLEIIKVDTDKFGILAQEYGIMSIPTLKLFRNGKVIKTSIGLLDENQLEDFIR